LDSVEITAMMQRVKLARGAMARLRRLERELDLELALQFGVTLLAFIGVVLSVLLARGFLLLTLLGLAILAHHALRGRSPVTPLLARLGLRSSSEIDRERYELAAIIPEPLLADGSPRGTD
jgi:hypothetical protein